MNKIEKLYDDRNKIVKKQYDILKKADDENRELTDQEGQRWEALNTDFDKFNHPIVAINREIERLEQLEQ